MFSRYNYLGFNNPYYTEIGGSFFITEKFSDVLAKINDRVIDPTSIVELLNKSYIFADRTMVKEVLRTPWHAKPNNDLTEWDYCLPPTHAKKVLEEEEVATTLFKKICLEIKHYVGNNKRIGVLLSGGMDSRMVAGALDSLIKSQELQGIEVVGLTWGDDGTRDVVYAEEIARRLNWHWKHYKVDGEALLQNIDETAVHGCEYSPIHLHAIPQIRDDNSLDIILAGSYGDSVGRAEFSGKGVRELRPIDHSMRNVLGLIKPDVYKNSLKEMADDISSYHRLFPAKEPYMQNEMDYELHYMRRMLNPCMELLNENSTICQVFTHPDVFGYMWSIAPEKRNNLVYKHMMGLFKTDLSDIPWSRTGVVYEEIGEPDKYRKRHHSYATIIQKEIFNTLKDEILSGKLEELNVLNMGNVKMLLSLYEKLPIAENIYIAEKLIWLASLSKMVSLYNVKPLGSSSRKDCSLFSKVSLSGEYLLRKMKNVLKK